MSFDHVMVPLDASPLSGQALALARRWTSAFPASRLTLAHVVEPWPSYMERVLFPYAAMGEDAVIIERELLDAAAAELRRVHALQEADELIVRMGRVSEAMPEIVKTQGPDMLIVGSHGDGGVMPELLGSSVERMIRAVVQPVWIARSASMPRKITVAVDLSPASAEVFRAALGVALACEAQLETVVIVPDPRSLDSAAGLVGQAMNFDAKRAIKQSARRIDALIERMHAQQRPHFPDRAKVKALSRARRTLVGDPATAIVDAAHESDAEMIIVGSRSPVAAGERPPAALGRVAWTVARRATTHVVVVPVGHELS